MKTARSVIVPAAILILLATVVCLFLLIDPWQVEIRLDGENKITIEAGENYEDAGADAYFHDSWFLTNGIKCEVKKEGEVNSSEPGIYIILYTAQGLFYSVTENRTVTVVDTTPPEIKLNGEETIELEYGREYTDQGCHAEDVVDGDISDQIKIDGSVNSTKPGTYELCYTAEDSSGNQASVSRTVVVQEPAEVDNYNKDKTAKPDSKSETESEINHAEIDVAAAEQAGNVIYLTFDDGPGPYTEKLLDILDKYDVKATFFVVNTKYTDLIQEEVERGHSVGIHSACHDYSQIYQSEDAFFKDLEKMQEIIQDITGITTNLIRFPGGSSNTISAKYCKGIMSDLTDDVQEKGYYYFDWNVASGDAGETTDTEEVYNNVIDGVQQHSVSIVLQHDIKEFSVNAVADIIKWGLENGYTFLPLSEESTGTHHRIFN